MSQNIDQIYTDNPASSMEDNDLMYLGRDPYSDADDFAIKWEDIKSSIDAVGTIATGVWNGTAIGITYGGTGVSSVTTTPTASAWAGWNSSLNMSANNFLPGFTSTVTAAGITVLTVASDMVQEFTGSTTQTVTLPVTSTLSAGFPFTIINNSSGAVTVQSSGGNAIQVMASNTSLYLYCVSTSGTGAASWNADYIGATSGIVNSGTTNQLAYYAASGTTLSGLATANNSVLLTNGSGVPSWNTTSSSLVTSITGTANQVVASASTGAVTLSLPQSIATTSNPTFNTLNITTNIQVSSILIWQGANGLAGNNVFGGGISGVSFTTGYDNTLLGYDSGAAITTGNGNTAVGTLAGFSVTIGGGNAYVGWRSGAANVDGGGNSAIGYATLVNATTGDDNTAIGNGSLDNLTGGSRNTCVGSSSGSGILTGNNNTFIGFDATGSTSSASGTIAIGRGAVAAASTGGTSGDSGPGMAIGSSSYPVGFRGDGTIYPTAGAISGYMVVAINGTNYKVALYALS